MNDLGEITHLKRILSLNKNLLDICRTDMGEVGHTDLLQQMTTGTIREREMCTLSMSLTTECQDR